MFQRRIDDFKEFDRHRAAPDFARGRRGGGAVHHDRFLCAAAFVFVLEKYGPVQACLTGAAIFFVVTLIAAGLYMVRKNAIRREMKARAEEAARAAAAAPSLLADPAVLAMRPPDRPRHRRQAADPASRGRRTGAGIFGEPQQRRGAGRSAGGVEHRHCEPTGRANAQFHSHLSSPGLTGRSSIPETSVFESRSRGVLDRPHARVDDSEYVALALPFPNIASPSRGTIARDLHFVVPRKTEGAGNAGCALHPRSRVQDCTKKAHTSIQVQRRQSGIPCAMALRLMPCSPRRRIRLVTVAAGLMADRSGWIVSATGSLAPATGVGTTRFCRTQPAPFVYAP